MAHTMHCKPTERSKTRQADTLSVINSKFLAALGLTLCSLPAFTYQLAEELDLSLLDNLPVQALRCNGASRFLPIPKNHHVIWISTKTHIRRLARSNLKY